MKARPILVFLFSVILGLGLWGATQLASARVLKWELKDVKFDDGDPVTGYFSFDADATPAKKLVSWDISIPALESLPAYRFSSAIEPENGVWLQPQPGFLGCDTPAGCLFFRSKILLDVDRIGRTAIDLALFPDSPLSNAGGKVALAEFPYGGFEACTYICPGRGISSGQLVAIPEPATGLILSLGLGAIIGFFCRTRPRKKTLLFVVRNLDSAAVARRPR